MISWFGLDGTIGRDQLILPRVAGTLLQTGYGQVTSKHKALLKVRYMVSSGVRDMELSDVYDTVLSGVRDMELSDVYDTVLSGVRDMVGPFQDKTFLDFLGSFC